MEPSGRDTRKYYFNGSGFSVSAFVTNTVIAVVHEHIMDGGSQYVLEFRTDEPDLPKVAPTRMGKLELDIMYELTIQEYAPAVNLALSQD